MFVAILLTCAAQPAPVVTNKVPPAKTACVCGASCACPAGKCPGSCPDEVATTTTGRTLHRRGTVWVYADDKPTPKAAPVVVGYAYQRVCNGGTCQIVKVPVYATK